MKLIEEHHINSAIATANNLSEEEIDGFVSRFKEAQPILFVYLLAVCEDELDDEEIESLFFTGVIIWYATQLAGANVPAVTSETLEEVDAQNAELLSKLSPDDEEEEIIFDFESLVHNHAQPNLLEFALVSSFDDEALDHDSAGLFFMSLKTFIECLDKQGGANAA
ncbi:hypothetical protein C7N43_26740 [Sphingobacteriales bacterium UPWRP_1]|nr:hypothetical protein BVG80_17955 [Sphingobacteriales bacterium TSM_CSM]PSJ73922.1 hypothetical protein C7N43_26740 [Sphingobacteriales bacterium UPWRP_1]